MSTNHRSRAGFTLLEVLIVVLAFGLVAVLAVPRLVEWSAAARVRMAASEVATALRLARSAAVRHSSRVGVKFETAGDFVVYNLYRDGDGDGVRTADIRNGTDPAIGLLRPLAHLGGRVDFGFPPGPPPTDPSDPDRTLGNLDDPIRFNNSDIASFSPLGESTPGSVYISDGQRQLVVVRLYGRTGRVRVLRWNATSRRWILVG